jgi:anti-anti-sigma factor
LAPHLKEPLDMQITVDRTGPVVVAAFEGRLDTVTAAESEQKLLGLIAEGSVVADLEGVRYLSSAGLRLLLKAAKQAKSAGVSFAVCAAQPTVREVFEISGFDKIITGFATRTEALVRA